MTNINITNFRKSIYELVEQAIKYNEPINISSKNGNAILLSEEDYNNIMETLYISSNEKLKKDIVEGINTTLEECINEDEVDL